MIDFAGPQSDFFVSRGERPCIVGTTSKGARPTPPAIKPSGIPGNWVTVTADISKSTLIIRRSRVHVPSALLERRSDPGFSGMRMLPGTAAGNRRHRLPNAAASSTRRQMPIRAPADMGKWEFEVASALAQIAAISIVRHRTVAGRDYTGAQLQRAIDSRIVIEQAKRVIAQQRGVRMDEAFSLLRTHSRKHEGRAQQHRRADRRSADRGGVSVSQRASNARCDSVV